MIVARQYLEIIRTLEVEEEEEVEGEEGEAAEELVRTRVMTRDPPPGHCRVLVVSLLAGCRS